MRFMSLVRRYKLSLVAALMIGGITSIPPGALSQELQELQEISRAGEKAILAGPRLEKAGALNPDLTIVEYFDYNCPFCKRVVPTFKQLLAEDKKLAIVYKDWPVLGESSAYAARCALAAGWQNKYLVAHDALLSGPRLSRNDQIDAILQGAGIDLVLLKKDLAAHDGEIAALLARNDAEAHALDLDGTPGILVGRQLMPGGADIGYFRKLIAAVRSGPK
jgi:protein-disulfide isomerase